MRTRKHSPAPLAYTRTLIYISRSIRSTGVFIRSQMYAYQAYDVYCIYDLCTGINVLAVLHRGSKINESLIAETP